MVRTSVLVLGLGFSLSTSARGQEPATIASRVDAKVSQVTTAGGWKTSTAHGYCRLIVISEGWEEIRHTVFPQWIEESERAHADRIRATVNLSDAAPGWFSFFEPKIVIHQPHDEVTVMAAPYPLGPEQALRFEIGMPSRLKEIGHVQPKMP